MLIMGLNKTTLLDYPGKVAATIFTGGCNFRCPYCHNMDLVINVPVEYRIPEETVMEHLRKRRNVLEGVCITGGEPTVQPDLRRFIEDIKELGYAVKLDTNGSDPATLKSLIDDKLVDYVAMDIKNSKERYIETAACTDKMLEDIDASVHILLENRTDYEFRTTIMKELHTKEEILKIAEWIKGAKHWYFQCYEESDKVMEKRFSAYSKEELEELKSLVTDIDVSIRGVY